MPFLRLIGVSLKHILFLMVVFLSLGVSKGFSSKKDLFDSCMEDHEDAVEVKAKVQYRVRHPSGKVEVLPENHPLIYQPRGQEKTQFRRESCLAFSEKCILSQGVFEFLEYHFCMCCIAKYWKTILKTANMRFAAEQTYSRSASKPNLFSALSSSISILLILSILSSKL